MKHFIIFIVVNRFIENLFIKTMVVIQRQQVNSMQQQQLVSSPTAVGSRKSSSNASTSESRMLFNNNTIDRRNSSFTSCAMGDDNDERDQWSVSTVSSHKSYNSSSTITNNGSSSSARKDSTTMARQTTLLPSSLSKSFGTYHAKATGVTTSTTTTPRWMVGLLCTSFIVFSWIRSYQYHTIAKFDILSTMDVELESLLAQRRQMVFLYTDAKNEKNSILEKYWKLKKVQRLFKHEERMMEEIAEMEQESETESEATTDTDPISKSRNDDTEMLQQNYRNSREKRSSSITDTWIQHRREILLQKVYSLQAYIQEESRKNVIYKYGPGPHFVRFDVKSREGRKPGSFVVKLAPLSVVPHSIETFLDMITNKVWDNTVLYSHHTQQHVIAAAPIVYGTFQSKDHQMESLGYVGVSFPEYSESFPHKQFTLVRL